MVLPAVISQDEDCGRNGLFAASLL